MRAGPRFRVIVSTWCEGVAETAGGCATIQTKMSSPLQDPTQGVAADAERAERARRVAAMLHRWQSEDVNDEPEWDVEQIERMDLTRSTGSAAT